jgi:hypothetical protein
MARILQPLSDAGKGTGSLSWTPSMRSAFQAAKVSLASAVPFQQPTPSAVLSLATDALDMHVGAVQQQGAQGS